MGLNKLYEKGVEKNVGGMGDFDKKLQAVFDQVFMKLSGYQIVQPTVKVKVETNKRDLKVTTPPGRGGSH
jgi:hypothetical protein